jgi:hypothetical protein
MGEVRRYRAIGGVAAWRVPVLGVSFAAAAALAGDWTLVVAATVLALAAEMVAAAVVFEVSRVGLARSVTVGGSPVGLSRVIAWDAVAEVTTDWRRPRDFTALETVVVGRNGERIAFGSRMGLAAYQRLVAEVVQHAPAAHCRGLTEEFLAERGWSRFRRR